MSDLLTCHICYSAIPEKEYDNHKRWHSQQVSNHANINTELLSLTRGVKEISDRLDEMEFPNSIDVTTHDTNCLCDSCVYYDRKGVLHYRDGREAVLVEGQAQSHIQENESK